MRPFFIRAKRYQCAVAVDSLGLRHYIHFSALQPDINLDILWHPNKYITLCTSKSSEYELAWSEEPASCVACLALLE